MIGPGDFVKLQDFIGQTVFIIKAADNDKNDYAGRLCGKLCESSTHPFCYEIKWGDELEFFFRFPKFAIYELALGASPTIFLYGGNRKAEPPHSILSYEKIKSR